MKIAVTGATGFIGRYILHQLAEQNHQLVAWRRASSDTSGLESLDVEWVEGDLTNPDSMIRLVTGCDAIVHSALWKPGPSFRGGEGPIAQFAATNIVGSLNLITSAIEQGVDRFIFLSTCAVHEVILDDRLLDEAHPCWAGSHYGAHKAAIEKFVHSFALVDGYNICALRPTGVYGLAHPATNSKWFDLIHQVAKGHDVEVAGGGKEVHALDVARAAAMLLVADGTAGEAFNCYDRYISRHEVASIARELSQSASTISGQPKSPKHQIETGKIKAKGMDFGGTALLRSTIQQIIDRC